MNRCHSLTKNNKRCRAIIKDNKLFCCKNHEPINNEIISDGCCMCMEKIDSAKDIIYLNCNHAFHKPCYNEWLSFSTYDGAICIICRSNKVSVVPVKKKNNIPKYNHDISKILNINKVLDNDYAKKMDFNIDNTNILNKNGYNENKENNEDTDNENDYNYMEYNVNNDVNNDVNNNANNNVNNDVNNNANNNEYDYNHNYNFNYNINTYINNYINGNTLIYDGPNVINEINNINIIYNNILNDN